VGARGRTCFIESDRRRQSRNGRYGGFRPLDRRRPGRLSRALAVGDASARRLRSAARDWTASRRRRSRWDNACARRCDPANDREDWSAGFDRRERRLGRGDQGRPDRRHDIHRRRRGKPLVKEAFTNLFRKRALAAGVSKSPHGLRKAAATADALDGYSDAELSAKFGWTGRQMASLYTRSANRERLSLEAARRTKERTKGPAPN
jgi:hypothetical protein